MARERQQLSIRDVANATNIRSDHIHALEEGNWTVFGAKIYAKGFVRTYAQHLKLDVAVVIADLEAQLAAGGSGTRFEQENSGEALTGTKEGFLDAFMLQISRVRWSIAFPLLLGIAIILAAVYGAKAWRSGKDSNPVQTIGPGLYQGPVLRDPAAMPLPTNPPPRLQQRAP
jgi:cytoskeletal protein RodZ